MACSHQALGSSGGDVQEVDFQEVDKAQDVNFSHPPPPKETTLYGTIKGGEGRPGPGANSTGGGTPEGNREGPA